MNALRVNPATGFLEQDSRNAFNSEQKLKFIALAQEYADRQQMPQLNVICAKVGIGSMTFYRHYDADAQFKEQWDEIICQVENVLSCALVENAKRANGVGAAAFWLKNRVPQRWSDNPGQIQTVVHLGDLKNVLNSLKSVAIDAEVVPNPGITSSAPKDAANLTAKPVENGLPSENK